MECFKINQEINVIKATRSIFKNSHQFKPIMEYALQSNGYYGFDNIIYIYIDQYDIPIHTLKKIDVKFLCGALRYITLSVSNKMNTLIQKFE